MTAVAVLLLPMLGLLLYVMDRIEERLLDRQGVTRNVRGHLRLVHSTSWSSAEHGQAGRPAGRRRDAA
ncbi:hypothetical protein ACIGPN_35985 [Streptomyces afghaniensis]|uniref:hypothetical protein n=1 Tax=Streptomyces afghaniensis TaxID=66865 RepID=UPI0037D2F4A8